MGAAGATAQRTCLGHLFLIALALRISNENLFGARLTELILISVLFCLLSFHHFSEDLLFQFLGAKVVKLVETIVEIIILKSLINGGD